MQTGMADTSSHDSYEDFFCFRLVNLDIFNLEIIGRFSFVFIKDSGFQVITRFYFMGEISVGRRILMSNFETRLANVGLSLSHLLSFSKLFQNSLR